MNTYKSLSELLKDLGCVLPYPNAGSNNKKSQIANINEIKKYNIDQYISHYRYEWETMHRKRKIAVYKFNGVLYSMI